LPSERITKTMEPEGQVDDQNIEEEEEDECRVCRGPAEEGYVSVRTMVCCNSRQSTRAKSAVEYPNLCCVLVGVLKVSNKLCVGKVRQDWLLAGGILNLNST
jgi:hypothetical protein